MAEAAGISIAEIEELVEDLDGRRQEEFDRNVRLLSWFLRRIPEAIEAGMARVRPSWFRDGAASRLVRQFHRRASPEHFHEYSPGRHDEEQAGDEGEE